jgi:hypothetical protein
MRWRGLYSFLSYGPWIFRLLLGGMTNLFAAASRSSFQRENCPFGQLPAASPFSPLYYNQLLLPQLAASFGRSSADAGLIATVTQLAMLLRAKRFEYFGLPPAWRAATPFTSDYQLNYLGVRVAHAAPQIIPSPLAAHLSCLFGVGEKRRFFGERPCTDARHGTSAP